MKACYIVKHSAPDKAFEVREVDSPERKKGEVKIAVEAFGLNYADVMARNGLYREAPPPPFVPGYEVVGKVTESDNKELIGKRVLAMTRFGGYAEEAVTREEGLVEIGENVSVGEAVALGTQYSTAYYCAYEAVNLFKGDRVLVHAAAGGVGIALTQLAKLKGCEVFGTASRPKKLEFMRQNGVDHAINYRENDYEKELEKLLGDARLDVCFNAIGGSTFKKDRRLLGSGGRNVLFGGAERSGKKLGFLSTLNFVWKMGLVIPIGLMMRSKGIVGVNMLKLADYKPDAVKRAMEGVVELHKDGKIKPHVGGDFSIEEITEAHALLEGRQSIGKIVVRW